MHKKVLIIKRSATKNVISIHDNWMIIAASKFAEVFKNNYTHVWWGGILYVGNQSSTGLVKLDPIKKMKKPQSHYM